MKQYHTYSADDIYKKFDTSKKEGLTQEKVLSSRKLYGVNLLPKSKKKSIVLKFLMQFKDWMIIVLLGAALISMILSFVSPEGDLLDAIIIIAIVIFNAIMGVVQEQKAENALAELKKLSQNNVTVIRDGKTLDIPSQDVVVGDIVIFEAGDILCADMFLVECASLKISEAALTGESKSVEKKVVDNLPEKLPLGDRINMAYSSSNVVYGRGVGVVVAVGKETEIGKIAQMLNEEKAEITPLQKNLAQLGKVITVIVLVIASLIFFLDIFVSGKDFLDSFMTAIAIAVSAIPESLPAVVTIIMALGIVKMSKRNAIVKKLHAVETLGACEIICTDKTGTLTQNKMQVKQAFIGGEFSTLKKTDYQSQQFLHCMTLCNDAKISNGKSNGDPTETALLEYALNHNVDKNKLDNEFKRISEIPFDSDRKLMSTTHFIDNSNVIYTKGAPDRLIQKCTHILINNEIIPIKNIHIATINDAIDKMGKDALRTLAFAFKIANKHEENIEENLIFIGLVGMADPARPQAKTAVKTCLNAGMRPIMITGDHANTAFAIAKELGIATKQNQVLLGSELDSMSDDDFMKIIKDIRVYARVSPQNKVRIVQGWKSLGKIVAMTGDGVNDAPSLKNAHIGIGMGISGTDVTKDVADIVLADDNFATIIYAVKEGRKIFENIQKTIQFLFSTNITEVIALVLATLFFPHSTFLLPIQILFINLVTDSLPAIALGMEKSEDNIMNKKPRQLDESVFSGGVGKKIIYQSLIQVAICMSVFLVAHYVYDPIVANTMAFLTINIVQLFHMFNVRTHKSIFKSNPFKNKLLIISFIVGFGLTMLVALVPFIASAFNLVALSIEQWAVIFGFAFMIIPLVECGKFIDNHITKED